MINFSNTKPPSTGFYGSTYQDKNFQPDGYSDLFKNYSNIPFNSYRTVFNDITDEWNSCSDDERKFIEADQSYVTANMQYNQQFNAFLLEQFGLQFINSKYGASAEKVYLALKEAKAKYKNSALEDVGRIKNENESLQKQLKELEKRLASATKNQLNQGGQDE